MSSRWPKGARVRLTSKAGSPVGTIAHMWTADAYTARERPMISIRMDDGRVLLCSEQAVPDLIEADEESGA